MLNTKTLQISCSHPIFPSVDIIFFLVWPSCFSVPSETSKGFMPPSFHRISLSSTSRSSLRSPHFLTTIRDSYIFQAFLLLLLLSCLFPLSRTRRIHSWTFTSSWFPPIFHTVPITLPHPILAYPSVIFFHTQYILV